MCMRFVSIWSIPPIDNWCGQWNRIVWLVKKVQIVARPFSRRKTKRLLIEITVREQLLLTLDQNQSLRCKVNAIKQILILLVINENNDDKKKWKSNQRAWKAWKWVILSFFIIVTIEIPIFFVNVIICTFQSKWLNSLKLDQLLEMEQRFDRTLTLFAK